MRAIWAATGSRGLRIGLSLALAFGLTLGGPARPDLARAVDTQAPELLAVVETDDLASYDHVGLLFSEPIDPTSIPDPGDFILRVGGIVRPVSDVNLVYQGLVGSQIAPNIDPDLVLTEGLSLLEVAWQTPAPAGTPITVSYSSTAHPIRDLAGNDLGDFPETEMVLVDFPLFIPFVDEGAGPDHLILFFSWRMGAGLPDPGDFSVEIVGQGSFEPDMVTRLHDETGATFIDLALPTSVAWDEAVALTYTPNANPLRDRDDIVISDITDWPVAVSVAVTPTRLTGTGPDVEVSPADSTTGAQLVSVTFDNVSTAGITTLSTTQTAPPIPAGLALGDPATFFNLSTTAIFAPEMATVCIDYGLIDFTDEDALQLLHYEGGSWQNVPLLPGYPDLVNQRICGRVSSFSPFAVAESRYRFGGFASPVDNPPVHNRASAGSAIPVKFGLGGNFGLDIFAPGYPQVRSVSCTSGDPTDAIEETVTAGSSGLSYAAGSNRYQYTWKTNKAWAGTCRELVIVLNDKTSHVARFDFKR